MTAEPELARARWRRPAWLAAGILLAGLLILGGYWFFSEGPGWRIISPRGATVASFSGDGDQLTQSFRVREGWRIQWASTGSAFEMAIDGDRNMGTVVQVAGPEDGLAAPPSAGTFHLEITATGSWTITVLQGR